MAAIVEPKPGTHPAVLRGAVSLCASIGLCAVSFVSFKVDMARWVLDPGYALVLLIDPQLDRFATLGLLMGIGLAVDVVLNAAILFMLLYIFQLLWRRVSNRNVEIRTP
jgi:hypothetical protein